MYRGDGEISEDLSDEAERPLTLKLLFGLALDPNTPLELQNLRQPHQESGTTHKLKPTPCPTSDLTSSVQSLSLAGFEVMEVG